MNRATRLATGVATIGLGLLLCSSAYKSLAQSSDTEQGDTQPSIEAIRELAELTVLEVRSTEVVTGQVQGHTGGTSVVVLVQGDILMGIDLEQAEFTKVNQDRRHLVLALPPPTVRRVAIDHRASPVIHYERSGLWRIAIGPAQEDQAIANAFTLGMDRLERGTDRLELTQRAKQHAQAVLGRFADEAGWTLEVHWRE